MLHRVAYRLSRPGEGSEATVREAVETILEVVAVRGRRGAFPGRSEVIDLDDATEAFAVFERLAAMLGLAGGPGGVVTYHECRHDEGQGDCSAEPTLDRRAV